MNYGLELLRILRKQRRSSGLLHRQYEDESFRLQGLIGVENKRSIKKECDERRIVYPKWRLEVEPKL
jgi:hypothetical protein